MQLRLGGYLQVRDGLRHVVLNARALGFSAVQIMVGGSKDYEPFDISPTDAAEYKKMTYGLATYVHLPFVINPCESIAQRRGFYRKAFREFSAVAGNIGAKAVVIHPGFKKELTEPAAFSYFIKFFEDLVDLDWGLEVLFETDAGSKNSSAIGSLEFLKKAAEALDDPVFGICLDTTHVYARGVNLWEKQVREDTFKRYGRLIKLVHLNSPDPDVELGSFRDRHNTTFEEHPDWDHQSLFRDLIPRWPCILERRSLAVQEQDMKFVLQQLAPAKVEEPTHLEEGV